MRLLLVSLLTGNPGDTEMPDSSLVRYRSHLEFLFVEKQLHLFMISLVLGFCSTFIQGECAGEK